MVSGWVGEKSHGNLVATQAGYVVLFDGGWYGGVAWGHGLKGTPMTITVNITPEVKDALARQATAHGRAVEVYAASLLEEAVHLPAPHPSPAKDMVELFAPLRDLNLIFERDRGTGRYIDR
jgi:plasmid stability protein